MMTRRKYPAQLMGLEVLELHVKEALFRRPLELPFSPPGFFSPGRSRFPRSFARLLQRRHREAFVQDERAGIPGPRDCKREGEGFIGGHSILVIFVACEPSAVVSQHALFGEELFEETLTIVLSSPFSARGK
jgi:hypothetical protein